MDLVATLTAPARLGIRVGREAVSLTVRGIAAAGALVKGGGRPAEPERPREARREPAPAGPTVEPAPRPATPPPVAPGEQPTDDDTGPEPRHVDEQATVVAEFAEAGAEEGAGAQVGLAEPWDGYDGMHVDELLPRLSDATSETLAAVVLYERSRRGRASVVEEAELQLRRRSAPGPA
jgi:hypothetical protein